MADRVRMHFGETLLVNRDYGPQAGTEGSEYAGQLRSGEKLTGTPTISVLPVTSPVLAPSSNVVNTAVLPSVNGRDIGIGEAVQFKLTGGALATETFEDGEVGTLYEVKVTVTTDSTPTQTFVDVVEVELVGAGSL